MSLLTLLSSFVITTVFLFVLKPLAGKIGLIDIPGGRKIHLAPTPVMGGIGIYLGILCVSLFTPAILQHYGMMLAISGLVLLVGIYDDARDMNASVRMGIHALAALLMVLLADNQLLSLGNILGMGPVTLGLLAIPVTMFATAGVINAVNMTDGVDGLSGGLVLISLGFISLAAFISGHGALLSFSTALMCALLAFLALNFRLPWKRSALIYLGDAGSTLLGFILTWLIIEATQGPDAIMAPVYALWFLAVPLIDTVNLLIKRPLRGVNPFSAGTDHVHHRLLAAGFSHQQTVIGLYLASLITGSIGLLGYLYQANEALMFFGFLVLFALYMTSGKYLKYLSLRCRSLPAGE